MRAAVGEAYPQALAFHAAQGRAGNAPVIGPSSKSDARCNLEFLIGGCDRPFPHPAAVAAGGHRPHIPIGQDGVRIEAVSCVVHIADDIIAAV